MHRVHKGHKDTVLIQSESCSGADKLSITI